MQNTTTTEPTTITLETAQADRDAKIKVWQDACARVCRTVKQDPDHPLLDLYRDQMEIAEDEYDRAEDVLRLVRDGYAHTYPHPAASTHPGDYYATVVLPNGLNRR
jgi:predicted Zn-dependent protease